MKLISGKGNNKIYNDLKTHDEKVMSGIRKGLFDVGKALIRHSKENIYKKPKGGKYYRLRKIKGRVGSRFLSVSKVVTHKASAPGEAPANFTGNLAKGLSYKVRGNTQLIFGNKAVSPIDGFAYSEHLEVKMNRPYLAPAVKEEEKNVRNYLIKSIRKELGVN